MKKTEAEQFYQAWLEMNQFVVARAGQKIVWVFDRKTQARKAISLSADFWGCIDLIAVRPDTPVHAIQVTTVGGANARRRKIETVAWPHAHMRVYVLAIEYDRFRGKYAAKIWNRHAGGWTTDIEELPITREKAADWRRSKKELKKRARAS